MQESESIFDIQHHDGRWWQSNAGSDWENDKECLVIEGRTLEMNSQYEQQNDRKKQIEADNMNNRTIERNRQRQTMVAIKWGVESDCENDKENDKEL